MFKWKEEYSVKVREIDEQHKQLFVIGDKIYEIAHLNDQHDHYDEIVDILEELRNYAIYHFDFEEKVLEKYGYSDLQTQQVEHMFFVKKLEKLFSKDIDGRQNETVVDIARFITDWITSHILANDMKYSDFLCEKVV